MVYATDSFADQLQAALQTTIVEVGNQIAKKTAIYKSGYDFLKKVYRKKISAGDLVLLRDDTVRPKFTNQWKGPYIIESVDRPNATISNLTGHRNSQTVHCNRLKIYYPSSTLANVSTPKPTITSSKQKETSENVEHHSSDSLQ